MLKGIKATGVAFCWSCWLEAFSKSDGLGALSARGRRANTGASVVCRWRPQCCRQQRAGAKPCSGRSRKDEGIGAAGWLQTGGWKRFWGRYQKIPAQVWRVNFKPCFLTVSQHCLLLATLGIRSDNLPQGSCSLGFASWPKLGRAGTSQETLVCQTLGPCGHHQPQLGRASQFPMWKECSGFLAFSSLSITLWARRGASWHDLREGVPADEGDGFRQPCDTTQPERATCGGAKKVNDTSRLVVPPIKPNS